LFSLYFLIFLVLTQPVFDSIFYLPLLMAASLN
jgi:hypothetical protein